MVIGLVLFGTILLAWYKKVSVFDGFVTGAKEGIATAFGILPSLVGLLVAVGMFRASGAMDLLLNLLAPVGRVLGIPAEVMPLALLRPVSGSGSLALVAELMARYGADSFIGRTASVLMGSTETTFYTLAVYFGSVGIRKTRHTTAAALIADGCAAVLAVAAVRVFFE